MKEANQPVNEWLCIAFIGVFCFWIVLYYVTEKTQAIGQSFVANAQNAQAGIDR